MRAGGAVHLFGSKLPFKVPFIPGILCGASRSLCHSASISWPSIAHARYQLNSVAFAILPSFSHVKTRVFQFLKSLAIVKPYLSMKREKTDKCYLTA